MDDNQENYLSMINKVQEVLHTYQTIFEKNKIILNTLASIDQWEKKVQDAHIRQQFDYSTLIEEKNKAKAKLVTQSVVLISIVRSYAADIDDNDLYKKVNYSKSAISHLRDNVIHDFGQFLLEQATNLFDTLTNYGLTQEYLDKYKTTVKTYTAAIPKPGAAIAKKAEATKELKYAVSELKKLVNRKLDNNMLLYMATNPEFYQAYISARKIYDTGYTTLAVKGNVMDAITQKPLYKVFVKFRPGSALSNSVKSVTKTTTLKGNYQFKGLPEGSSTLTFEKDNYETVEKKVEIIHGSTEKLDVALKPI